MTELRCENVDESAGLVRACETYPDDTIKNWCWPCVERHVDVLARHAQDRDAFRAALERISETNPTYSPYRHEPCDARDCPVCIAREALSKVTQ